MKKLILMDHDGTLCDTSECAYDSIKYAAQAACRKNKIDYELLQKQWDIIVAETAGTTEKNLVKNICIRLDILPPKSKKFEQDFYFFRSDWFRFMKKKKEFIYDTYYPDAEHLVQRAYRTQNFYCYLVTGNPKLTATERLTPHMRVYFSEKNGGLAGAFGEEGWTRQDLMEVAIKKCSQVHKDFRFARDTNGFYTNVFYIGDTYSEFVSALRAKIKIIWIPSRTLQVLKKTIAQEHVGLLRDAFPRYLRITNNLETEDISRFLGIPLVKSKK
jgi:phosphoglycolate phosphatase-like HAD superfamily hydrolase